MSAPYFDAIDIALRVAHAIEAAGGRYFVGGSVASSFQGEPRATNDIDVVVDLPRGCVRAFVEALGADFECDLDGLRRAVSDGTSHNIFFLPLVTKIDVFGRGREPFDDVEFERRRLVTVRASGAQLWLKSPEDTVLRKLLWYREGGEVSSKQWRDVVQVLRVSGPVMDGEYMAVWASHLGASKLLDRAREEAAASIP